MPYNSKSYRNNGRQRKPDSGNRTKLALLFAIPAVTLAGVGVGMAHYMGIERIGADYCFMRPGQPIHAVFVDASVGTNLSARQVRDNKAVFTQIFETAPSNTRIDVFTTNYDTDGSIARPVASICKPVQTEADLAAIGAPSQNPSYLARQAAEAQAEFNALVETVIRDLRNVQKAAKDSPILESLQGISRYPGFSGPDRSLSVITDGIQNSETARFCQIQGDMPPFSVFRTQRRYTYVKPDAFEGVDVNLLLVESLQLPQRGLEHCSNHELRKWWPDYFKANGAVKVTLTRLRYGAQ